MTSRYLTKDGFRVELMRWEAPPVQGIARAVPEPAWAHPPVLRGRRHRRRPRLASSSSADVALPEARVHLDRSRRRSRWSSSPTPTGPASSCSSDTRIPDEPGDEREERGAIGVIGTGFGARVVAPVFQETEGCEVVDVVTPRDDAAVTALCARRDVDLISVQSPPFLHRDHVRRAIEAGHAVLCDKPFGRNLADAQAMYDLAAEAARPQLRELRVPPASGAPRAARTRAATASSAPSSTCSGASSTRVEVGCVASVRLVVRRRARRRLDPPVGIAPIDFMRWTFGEIVDATGAIRTTITERADTEGRMRPCTAEDGYTAVLLTAGAASATIDGTATNSALATEPADGDRERRRARADQREPARGGRPNRALRTGGLEGAVPLPAGQTRTSPRCGVGDRSSATPCGAGARSPDAPTFADGLACSRVIDRLEQRALTARRRDEEPS